MSVVANAFKKYGMTALKQRQTPVLNAARTMGGGGDHDEHHAHVRASGVSLASSRARWTHGDAPLLRSRPSTVTP